MLKKLKDILNIFTDEELEEFDLWINSSTGISNIIIDNHSIDLITNKSFSLSICFRVIYCCLLKSFPLFLSI